MGRLFWKIFLWFWLAMVLMTLGIAWGMAQFFQDESDRPSRRSARLAAPQVLAVASVLQHNGESAAKRLLQELIPQSSIQILVVDDQGEELLGRSLPKVLGSEPRDQARLAPSVSPPERFGVVTDRMVDSLGGRRYRIVADFSAVHRASPRLHRVVPFGLLRPLGHRDPWVFFLRLSIAVFVSGLVCFWLAWYLAGPVRHLRKASRRLSEGDLDVRVTKAMGRRRDEIADLGRDFDRMAERLQALISAQQQLLSDVSHELRSPLARLQVALGLARKKAGEQAVVELDRIEREADRLDNLVGQVLTLARLEAGVMDAQEDYVDIAVLLEEITQDAEFEVADRQRLIHLSCEASRTLKVNAELLRRALENVIRNAVNYTAEETQVEVTLRDSLEEKGCIAISICDRGPGVPDEQLSTLFEPFVRVAKSRGRDSGGYGLGLAIDKRAILLHGGHILAQNRSDRGLCVSIQLPVCE